MENTYYIKVSYTKYYVINAENETKAMNKAIDNYYRLSELFDECSANILDESEGDKHKFVKI